MNLDVRPRGRFALWTLESWRRRSDIGDRAEAETPAASPALADDQVGDVRARDPDDVVRYGLRVAAGYAWRTIVLLVLIYLLAVGVRRVQFVAISVFVGLVITTLLKPLTNACAKIMPRGLAVAVSFLVALAVGAGGLTLVAESVVMQQASLSSQFNRGVGRLQKFLQGKPFHLRNVNLSRFSAQVESWISAHQGTLVHQVLSGANLAAQLLAGLALAVFCSVCFLYSGESMWKWFLAEAPVNRARWDAAGRAAWTTFAGYTRGVLIISATNAVLVGVTLFLLRVPLALPLATLVFFAAFIPLIGSSAALAVATVVALATRGPWIALSVLGLIVVIGEVEGHLLHPFVMSRAVKLHPVVVVVSVAIGGLLDGIIGAAVAVPLVSVTWAVISKLRSMPGGIMPASTAPATVPTSNGWRRDPATTTPRRR